MAEKCYINRYRYFKQFILFTFDRTKVKEIFKDFSNINCWNQIILWHNQIFSVCNYSFNGYLNDFFLFQREQKFTEDWKCWLKYWNNIWIWFFFNINFMVGQCDATCGQWWQLWSPQWLKTLHQFYAFHREPLACGCRTWCQMQHHLLCSLGLRLW